MKNKVIKTKRRFVFVDESGDPGFVDGSSNIFQLNILVIDDDEIRSIEREIYLYKYFLDHHGELKENTNIKNKRMKNLLTKIGDIQGSEFFYTQIDKNKYNGPYKNKPFYFRNMLLKRVLQYLRKEKYIDDIIETEIVIDRYVNSRLQKNELENYLSDGYNLPKFLHIEQVDSRYCHMIQVLDMFGTFCSKDATDIGKQIKLKLT